MNNTVSNKVSYITFAVISVFFFIAILAIALVNYAVMG